MTAEMILVEGIILAIVALDLVAIGIIKMVRIFWEMRED